MILITGGAGFIGSVLAEEFNNQGITDLIIADRLTNVQKNNNLERLRYAKYLDADQLFDGHTPRLQTIFHMGACSSTLEQNVEYLNKNNVEYSKKMFRLALKHNCPFIYASSAATYGDGSQGYDDDHSKIPLLSPLNPYGRSKQEFDCWILQQKEYPPVWFGLKFFNVYGPHEYHKGEMCSVVYKAYQQIQETKKVKLFKSYKKEYSDGGQLRDFIYVKDVTRGMLAFSQIKKSATSGIYNIGTGKARTFYDLANNTFKAMGEKTRVEYIEMPNQTRFHYQYFTQAKMNKFKSLFPHFLFSTLEEGITDYVQNYLRKIRR